MGIVHHRWNLCCDYDWPSSGRIRNIPYASSPRATCPLTGRTAPTLIVCRGLCPSSRRRFLVSQTPQKANTQHTHGQHESTSPPAVANHTYTRRPVRRKTRRKAAAPPSPGAEAPSRRAAQPGPSCRGTYQFQAWAASPYSCAGGGRGGGASLRSHTRDSLRARPWHAHCHRPNTPTPTSVPRQAPAAPPACSYTAYPAAALLLPRSSLLDLRPLHLLLLLRNRPPPQTRWLHTAASAVNSSRPRAGPVPIITQSSTPLQGWHGTARPLFPSYQNTYRHARARVRAQRRTPWT